MIQIPFQIGKDISNCKELFGRDSQIEQLTSLAKRHENAGIIGARRFGKTCLLKSMMTLISNSDIDAFPVYFDAKASGIKRDTDLVFRRLTSLLLCNLCGKGILESGKINLGRSVSIDVSDDNIDIEEQLSTYSSERQRESLKQVSKVANTKGKYVLLLLDEIDYLLLNALESPADFGRIRGLASEGDSMKFWIAGTASWSYMCTKIGSAELNCGLTPIYLPPISSEAFAALWNSECDKINDSQTKESVRGNLDTVLKASGGVPFYSKVIGHTLCVKGTQIKLDYTILRDYLKELLENQFFSERDRELLVQIAKCPQNFEDTVPDELQSLISRGLVAKSKNGQFHIPIGYLRDYILSVDKCPVGIEYGADQTNEEDKTPALGETEWLPSEIVKEIGSLRERIVQVWKEERKFDIILSDTILKRNNPTLYNKIVEKGGYPPFDSTVGDPKLFGNLEHKCCNLSDFYTFSGAMYSIFYEGTHKGWNLPPTFAPFIRQGRFRPNIVDNVSMFAQIVKVNRHVHGGHSDYTRDNPDDISVECLLSHINNGNHLKDSDCPEVQKRILEMCLDYMKQMLKYLQDSV